MIRKKVTHRFCGSRGAIAMSTGYPGSPTKPGNGFATSETKAVT